MTADEQGVSAGRVGRPHGLDGSFYVEDAVEPLAEGAPVWIGGHAGVVERCAGTLERPLVRVRGIADRNAAAALRGERLVVPAGELAEGEYLASDLVRCEVPGVGRVRRVVATPSCDVLEVGDAAVLVPFVSDAIASVDLDARVIEVDREFLGLDGADA